MNTSPEFKAAVARFLTEAQAIVDTRWHSVHDYTPPREVLTVDPGRRYVRIWLEREGHRSAFCFIDSTNGDVLKCETWKKPAKHARGSIYTGKASDAVGPHGAHYLA